MCSLYAAYALYVRKALGCLNTRIALGSAILVKNGTNAASFVRLTAAKMTTSAASMTKFEPITNLDVGDGWYASRVYFDRHLGQQLTLRYVDPDRVLDEMLFRQVVVANASEQMLDLSWTSLVYFAEDYVRQQLLRAYENTIRDT